MHVARRQRQLGVVAPAQLEGGFARRCLGPPRGLVKGSRPRLEVDATGCRVTFSEQRIVPTCRARCRGRIR